MELGGKSPVVVFADADLDAAIDATIFGVFSLNGERCTAGLAASWSSAACTTSFVRALRRAGQARRGSAIPHDPQTEVGALVHPEHYDKVMSYVEIGKTEGAPGRRRRPPEGFPTRQLRRADRVRRRRRRRRGSSRRRSSARSSRYPVRRRGGAPAGEHDRYGLAAYIWTNDLKRAHNFAQRRGRHGLAQLEQRARPPHPVRRREGVRLGHEGGPLTTSTPSQERAYPARGHPRAPVRSGRGRL